MSDDVLCVKFSPNQRLLAVSLLDYTVKVFFADTLKVRLAHGGVFQLGELGNRLCLKNEVLNPMKVRKANHASVL